MKACTTALLSVLWFALASACLAADPFDFPTTISQGPFARQPVDTSEKRPLVRINGHCYANLLHRDRFWKVCFDPEAVQDVIVQKTPFGETRPGSHLSWRFVLRPAHPARLTPNEPGEEVDEEVLLRDVVFSAEATYAVGQSAEFDIQAAWRGEYNIVLRAMSLQTQAALALKHGSSAVQQYPLRLSENHKQQMLRDSCGISDRLSNDIAYDLWRQNCRTIFFDVLSVSGGQVGPFIRSAPLLPIWRLRFARLIETNHKLPSLQVEVFGKNWREACHNQIRDRAAETFPPSDFF